MAQRQTTSVTSSACPDPDPSLAQISSACFKEERKSTLSPDQSSYLSLSCKAFGQGKGIKDVFVCLLALNLNKDQNSGKKISHRI